jgi:hypothetical protein
LSSKSSAADELRAQRSSHFGSRLSIKALNPSSASRAIRFSAMTSEAGGELRPGGGLAQR